MNADTIGWIATAIVCLGSLFVAHKSVVGLWLFLISNLMFAAVGWAVGLPSLIFVSLFLTVLDLYGIWKWGHEKY